MLKEMTITFTDSSVGTAVDTAIICRTGGLLQYTWVNLTPVICPPASMSWVWGMAACTEGCWEGWLGC